MKMNKTLSLLLLFLTINCYSQNDNEKLDEKEIKRMMEEVNAMYGNKQQKELIIINPEILDAFIENIKINNIDSLYKLTDEDIQKVQSKEDIEKVFNLYTKYYGKVVDYEQTSFGMRTKWAFGQLATVSYDINFEKNKGKANGVFKVYDEKTVKMFSYNISIEDYTVINKLDSISKPIINLIIEKNKKAIYTKTTEKFKKYNSISDFESIINKLLSIDLEDYKTFRYQFGIKDDKEIVIMYYELRDDQGYIKLDFVQNKDNFELEGLNYISKE
jgi:hypothetical protein